MTALQAVPGEVKWVDSPNLHLTLKFLGEVETRDIPDVCRVAGQAVADLAPFTFEVHGVGAFPNLQRPRTFWLGAREGHEAMGHAGPNGSTPPCKRSASRRESRRFEPHLTIGPLAARGPHQPRTGRRATATKRPGDRFDEGVPK